MLFITDNFTISHASSSPQLISRKWFLTASLNQLTIKKVTRFK
ncbi:hypothetical protein Nizo2264_0131 [Lactiplantibacillus plantarum]|nr:hypothetical protein Nizo2264_0131 [Lactiplantibacillus plantarum]